MKCNLNRQKQTFHKIIRTVITIKLMYCDDSREEQTCQLLVESQKPITEIFRHRAIIIIIIVDCLTEPVNQCQQCPMLRYPIQSNSLAVNSVSSMSCTLRCHGQQQKHNLHIYINRKYISIN